MGLVLADGPDIRNSSCDDRVRVIASRLRTQELYAISYAVAFFIMEYILHKNFRRFRIGLVSCRGKFTSQVTPAAFARTARVWWTYLWRTVMWRLVIFFVAFSPIAMLLGLSTRMPVSQDVVWTLLIIAIDAAAGLFVIWANILDEDFGDFRVCVLPLRNDPAASALPVVTSAASIPAATSAATR
ncbi:MAG TPA: hypothetical protein VKB40_03820 [Candidatus Acidoferrales bacterium]|nr:hypothetical protein [Candidatus Acidoferrales bacterium]